MAEMKVETVSLKDIKPYEKNAKKHPEKQIEYIANSIKEFGWTQPIVLDENGEIIIGHGRYLAAKKLELETGPCIYERDLSEIQQMQTQKQSGGLTDAYLHYGTYVKSFYAVMMNPSCVKVAAMGDPKSGNYRMHHRVRYDLSCPVIISDKYRKKRGD